MQCDSGFVCVIQVDRRRAKHLENISRLQLYEYQLDDNLCHSIPSAMPLKTSNEKFVSNRTNSITNHLFQRDQSNRVQEDDHYLLDGGCDDLYPTNADHLNAGRRDKEAESCCRRVGEMEGMRRQVGLLAQEVEQVLPNAVRITVSSLVRFLHDHIKCMTLYNQQSRGGYLYAHCADTRNRDQSLMGHIMVP